MKGTVKEEGKYPTKENEIQEWENARKQEKEG